MLLPPVPVIRTARALCSTTTPSCYCSTSTTTTRVPIDNVLLLSTMYCGGAAAAASVLLRAVHTNRATPDRQNQVGAASDGRGISGTYYDMARSDKSILKSSRTTMGHLHGAAFFFFSMAPQSRWRRFGSSSALGGGDDDYFSYYHHRRRRNPSYTSTSTTSTSTSTTSTSPSFETSGNRETSGSPMQDGDQPLVWLNIRSLIPSIIIDHHPSSIMMNLLFRQFSRHLRILTLSRFRTLLLYVQAPEANDIKLTKRHFVYNNDAGDSSREDAKTTSAVIQSEKGTRLSKAMDYSISWASLAATTKFVGIRTTHQDHTIHGSRNKLKNPTKKAGVPDVLQLRKPGPCAKEPVLLPNTTTAAAAASSSGSSGLPSHRGCLHTAQTTATTALCLGAFLATSVLKLTTRNPNPNKSTDNMFAGNSNSSNTTYDGTYHRRSSSSRRRRSSSILSSPTTTASSSTDLFATALVRMDCAASVTVHLQLELSFLLQLVLPYLHDPIYTTEEDMVGQTTPLTLTILNDHNKDSGSYNLVDTTSNTFQTSTATNTAIKYRNGDRYHLYEYDLSSSICLWLMHRLLLISITDDQANHRTHSTNRITFSKVLRLFFTLDSIEIQPRAPPPPFSLFPSPISSSSFRDEREEDDKVRRCPPAVYRIRFPSTAPSCYLPLLRLFNDAYDVSNQLSFAYIPELPLANRCIPNDVRGRPSYKAPNSTLPDLYRTNDTTNLKPVDFFLLQPNAPRGLLNLGILNYPSTNYGPNVKSVFPWISVHFQSLANMITTMYRKANPRFNSFQNEKTKASWSSTTTNALPGVGTLLIAHPFRFLSTIPHFHQTVILLTSQSLVTTGLTGGAPSAWDPALRGVALGDPLNLTIRDLVRRKLEGTPATERTTGRYIIGNRNTSYNRNVINENSLPGIHIPNNTKSRGYINKPSSTASRVRSVDITAAAPGEGDPDAAAPGEEASSAVSKLINSLVPFFDNRIYAGGPENPTNLTFIYYMMPSASVVASPIPNSTYLTGGLWLGGDVYALTGLVTAGRLGAHQVRFFAGHCEWTTQQWVEQAVAEGSWMGLKQPEEIPHVSNKSRKTYTKVHNNNSENFKRDPMHPTISTGGSTDRIDGALANPNLHDLVFWSAPKKSSEVEAFCTPSNMYSEATQDRGNTTTKTKRGSVYRRSVGGIERPGEGETLWERAMDVASATLPSAYTWARVAQGRDPALDRLLLNWAEKREKQQLR